ncbi:DUF3710 domain-containing protein [Nostocoides sp. HKS02]|uniref:DUF3710 domain-containing protein n=1 Tax=Nostocoides sp. HKS02 TaxID=1813880 RepID=UPI0012B4D79E|nr:DUF3710 domain-containing protein [Tetrasphaera sp. HKS02]QGN57519.1 DUF3710 domain-containing protein [Tetrasphaera sp. HKS02]
MSIFRRRKGTTDAIEDPTTGVTSAADGSAAELETPQVAGTAPAAVEPTGSGPFDAAEVESSDDGRLDLGALRIRGVAGMELRLEVDEEGQQVVGATAVIGDSAVQLQAFAAPRTAGVWDEIREEIAQSIVSQGGTADDVRGELGRELRTRMPSAGPDGRTVYAPARFVGVDGPRWFLRAVFSGRAAIEDEAAAPLMEVVRDTVVVRGDAAMAPREMLPLRLPEETVAPGELAGTEDVDGQPRRADDLKPFERGPEITEVR